MKVRFDCRGSTIIEFALILPLLVAIALISLDFSLYLFDRQKASTIVSSQVSGVVRQSNTLDIKAELEGVLAKHTFFRVKPQDNISVYSVCLCGDENFSDLAEASAYLCKNPPRCQPSVKSYVVISIDFLLDTSNFILAKGTFLPSFTETVVIRQN